MAAIAEMPDAEGLTTFFKSVGYPEKNAKKYAKSKKDSVALYGTLKEANIDSEMPNALANLMYEVAKSVPKSHLIYRPTIANMVKDSKLDTKQRISAAAKFLKKIILELYPNGHQLCKTQHCANAKLQNELSRRSARTGTVCSYIFCFLKH